MNKADLIEFMANDTKNSKAACKESLESAIKGIESALKKGKSVVITGFGTFDVLKRKQRKGINPATGKEMTIPAKKVPKFKPGKRLKDLVQ